MSAGRAAGKVGIMLGVLMPDRDKPDAPICPTCGLSLWPNAQGHEHPTTPSTPADRYDETAAKILPCRCATETESGEGNLCANCLKRPAIAAALREAEQRGYANGAEAQIGATEQVQAIFVERDRQIVEAEARVAELEEAEADRRAGVYVPQVTLAELMREREVRVKAEAERDALREEVDLLRDMIRHRSALDWYFWGIRVTRATVYRYEGTNGTFYTHEELPRMAGEK